MKNIFHSRFLFALLGFIAPAWLCEAQTIFFSDNFSGSTTNLVSARSGSATASSTSYDIASSKNTIGDTTIVPNDLHLTLSTATGSGYLDAQALFMTNGSPVALTEPGDYIELDVVFTNTGGTLLYGGTKSALWIGLYSSGGSAPVSGGALANSGLTTTSGSSYATGNCADWLGYVGGICADYDDTQTRTRPLQNGTGTASANQELLGNDASGGTYDNPAGTAIQTVTPTPTVTLTSGATYTLDLTIYLDAENFLTISNTIYNGVGTSGSVLFSQGSTNIDVASSTYETASFDSLGIGFFNSSSPSINPIMDISSILITGHSSVVTTPPNITAQPQPVLVATNGSCAFSISATDPGPITYQWYRNDTALTNNDNISGATSSELIISSAGTADQFTGLLNGYYCLLSGSGYTTNSTTNTLTLINATNLLWTGNSETWDVDNTQDWVDTNGNPSFFNFGDPVAFTDAGQGGFVNLTGNYISASSVTVDSTLNYTFQGTGSIAGPGPLDYIGSGRLILNADNTYTGGTVISNANAYVYLENYAGLGTGPVNLDLAGGEMEIVPTGSASAGIAGAVNVADDFTIQFDGSGSYAGVFMSDFSGTAGKTLTLIVPPANTSTNERIRFEGIDTTYNANLSLNSSLITLAPYNASGIQTYNGVISGSGAMEQKGVFSVFTGPNTYSGGMSLSEGVLGFGISTVGSPGSITSGPIGPSALLLFDDSSSASPSGNGEVLAYGGSCTIANAIQYPSSTNNLILEIGGANNLTFTGPFTLNGNDAYYPPAYVSRTVQVTNTALTTFSGVISDQTNGVSAGYALTITGNGTNFVGPLILTAANTYSGPTTNAGAVLLVNGSVGPGEVVVSTNGTLGGTGIITGPVIIQSNATLTAGTQLTPGVQGIGILTISNSLTFLPGSTSFVQVTSSTHDLINVSNAVSYAGTLLANNISGTLSVGDSFQIFNVQGTKSGNFSTIAGTPGPGLAWSFNPANGTLSVITGNAPFTISPGVTNITLSGSNVVLSGTNAQSGAIYYLLTSTNLLVPVKDWLPVSTNIASGANAFTFIATNAITAHDAQQFYIFSNTNN